MLDHNALSSKVEQACKKYDVKRLELIGSAARDDFKEDSDVDFLVEFYDIRRPGISQRYFDLIAALEKIFSRKIDLIDINAIKNPYFMESINKNRLLIYGT